MYHRSTTLYWKISWGCYWRIVTSIHVFYSCTRDSRSGRWQTSTWARACY